MKITVQTFQTKVARRIFLLFIISAIVPILVLAWVSFHQVNQQIREQTRHRLVQDAKGMGMSIIERLVLLDAQLHLLAHALNQETSGQLSLLPPEIAKAMGERFVRAALVADRQNIVPVIGPALVGEEEVPTAGRQHLAAGKTLLQCRLNGSPGLMCSLSMVVRAKAATPLFLVAEINPAYLWSVAETRPADTEVTVFDEAGRRLFSSLAGSGTATPRDVPSGHAGFFQDRATGTAGAYWSIYLESNLGAPPWKVVLQQSEDSVLAPLARFRTAFVLAIVVAFCVVGLLATYLIRRNTAAIEILKEGTQRIAQGAFGEKVTIRSGDEFESLAAAFNDMSQKVQEGQRLLVQAAKLSTMGQMAAGIIHEVKQPLTAIHGLLQLVLMTESAPKQVKRLETAFQTVERLHGILERFRAFSRSAPDQMEPLSLRQVADQVCALMEHQFMMKHIQWTIEGGEGLPPVWGDRNSLHQVYSNLLVNAIQAMEVEPESRRTLEIRLHGDGQHVISIIRDTGCGMPPEVLERMFDPFFTTKHDDKGTGLGMPIVASILHKHGARIDVESAVGIGTTFTLTFPNAPQDIPGGAKA